MSSLKKINLIIASVLLVLTGIFFIGCGKTDYSSISLTCDEAEVTMDLGETRTINFKIENYNSGMSGKLALSVLDNSGCISYEMSDPRNGVTTVSVEAKAGGTTSLRAVTIEGNKECVVTINVREYSQSLSPSDERLFVSNSTEFTPSSSHFIFDTNATEKNLKYYFFGTIAPGISGEKLTLDSVKQGEEFINEFVSVRMETVGNENYLVFKDGAGTEYTLKDLTATIAYNQRYEFIALNKTEDDKYDFSEAFKVSIGNKFSFVAHYMDEIFASRDFYVMPDIITEPITWEYSFQHGSGQWAPEDLSSLDKVVIVPNRQIESIGGNTIDYSKVKLEVTIPFTGDNVKMKYSVDNTDILNVDRLNSDNEDTGLFEFAVSGKTSVAGNTNIRINIYYEGFENSKDQSVNYEYIIPVEIKFEPKGLTVSGGELGKSTFYNNYSGLNYGWQEFYLFVNPDTCSYDELKVIYNPNEVMLRYNMATYWKGEGTYLVDENDPGGNRYIKITDINRSVEIKGVNGAAQVENGKVYFELSHNVLGVPSDARTIVQEIDYQIKAGATSLEFREDAELYKNSGVYIALDGGETLFNLLQANADFTYVEFTYRSTSGDSVDVVNLSYNRADSSTNGIANIRVTPKALGWGTYVIRLDNGLATEVTFRVIETLQSVTVAGGTDTAAITRLSTDKTENEGGADAEVFILSERDGDNLLPTSASIELFVNGNRNSTAMLVDRVDETVVSGGFNYSYLARSLNPQSKVPGAYLDIKLTTVGDGNGAITFNIKGYQIENFKRKEVIVTYKINVVSYSLIGKLNVLKTKDGNGSYLEGGETTTPANYVFVYKMTSNIEPRTAKFSVLPRYAGYLFKEPTSNGRLMRETFLDGSGDTPGSRARFVYWTIPGNDIQVTNSSGIATRMVYNSRGDNSYTIGNYGIFDTEEMSFTAFQEAEDFTFDIIAHVEQADGRTFSFPINIQALNYAEVRGLTVQPNVINDELNFSLAQTGRKKDIIIYTSPSNSTNSTVVVQFTPATIQGKDEEGQSINIPVNLFGEYDSKDNSYEGLKLKQVDGASWLLSMDVSKFIENNLEIANLSTQSLSGTLVIAAADWLDASGNIKSNFLSSVKRFTVNFANGSKANPFYLETAQDVINIKDGLNAHYRLATSIDMTSYRNQLPLGRFSGSIIGTNDYAKISGLVLNNTVESQTNYGLFTEVVRQKIKDANGQDTAEDDLSTGLIENIEFEGSINLSGVADGTNIGLVTAVNKGTLRNLGITVSGRSQISLQGKANIGYVAGVNEGLIEQDFVYATKNSLSTKILVYATEQMIITPANKFSSVYAGGVVGLNRGIITKIDKTDLNLYGYSQYFVYANIIINRLVDSEGGVSSYEADITRASAVGTIAGYSQSGGSIAGRGYRTDYGKSNIYDEENNLIDGPKKYNFAEGILVGGRVEGPQYVGGAVGYFEGTSPDGTGSNYIENTSDEEGNPLSIVHLEFNGITSRTFVYGYTFNSEVTVGAITGYISNVYFNSDLLADFAVQAVDDGREGLNASIVVRHLTSSADALMNVSSTPEFLNIIAFGTGDGNVGQFIDSQRMRRYLKRDYNKMTDGETLVVEVPGSTRNYYGDFVEVAIEDLNKTLTVRNQLQFEEDLSSWSISVNSDNGFKSFIDEAGNPTNNVYYAYYFAAESVEFSDKEEDVMDAQELLDQYLNYIKPNGNLYPIIASNGLIFSSANPEILSFNQAGNITIRSTGTARVDISSILNENDKMSIYIKVVNYFNIDEDMSIVYPDLANDSVPVDATIITLKGSNSVSLYVRPDYSLNYGEMDEFGHYDISIDGNGAVQMIGGMLINLAPNTEVQPEVGYNDKDEEGNFKDYFTQREGTAPVTGEVAEVNILINGQTVSFSKKPNSKEGTYALSIKTKIVANVDTGSGLKPYYCYVNKDIKRAVLSYTKGAEIINAKNYDELTIATSKVGEDYIVINSPSVEDKPKYVIYKVKEDLSLGDIVQGTYEAITDIIDGLFTVEFSPDKQESYGKQEFLMNISVDKTSYEYTHRHEKNIYGRYRIYIYASSDPTRYVVTEIYLVNMEISNVVVDNYSDISALEESLDFATASDKALPGKTGLLMINVTPEDSDFDYIEITNTDASEQPGNGKASFNLVARLAKRGDNGKIFDEKRIAGSTLTNGIRLYQNDIVELYSTVKEGTSQNIYELYRGIIYLNYYIPTNGVLDESLTEFNIVIYKDGKPVYKPTIVQLTNNLTYQAYVTIDNKTMLDEKEQGIYASYHVARGLKYKLNLNYFGFSFDNISITTSSPEKAEVVYENGSYYLNITSDPFDYSLSNENGFPISIFVNALQTVDEEIRQFTSVTKVKVLEYVLDYNWENGKPLLDIVNNMDQGVINIQVGNRQELSINIVDLIEFDTTNPTVVSEVEAFMNNLTSNGTWTVYTNLNDSNMSNGKPVTSKDGKPIAEGTYESRHTFGTTPTYNILYFKSTGLSISPTVTHDYLNSYYVFSFNNRYKIDRDRGCFTSSSDTNDNRLYTEFRFNVFQSSSEESPIPIDNFEDLMDMQSGAYYRLVKNITLDNETFVPISAQIASLDGNGYTIYMNGVYNTNQNNIGLFTSVADGTVIKNLNIALSGDTVFMTTADSFFFGMLAGENAGNITNCYVYSESASFSTQSYFLSVESSALDSASYVAGLVGQNSGNITNSRSAINISSSFNVAGLVGINSGKIASSYFKNGTLIGTTQSSHKLGGLVVSNAESGKIITSYVSGASDNGLVYSSDVRHYLSATSPEGGFAYANRGTIADCYSNIKMLGSSTMAGFVFENGGLIRNSFSLSVLIDSVLSSAGFSMTNYSEDELGSFENCYYFSHVSEGLNDQIGNINTSLANVSFARVSKLDVEDFAKLEQYFGEYSYSKTLTNNAVWYMSDGKPSDIFNNEQFNLGRLELVAPNIIAFSEQELIDTIEDEETGDVRYVYAYTLGSEILGSIKNPHVIDDAESMEREFVERASRSGFNLEHYRLINDINYAEYDALSNLYTVSFAGSLEGNGMEISQYSLLSQKSLTNAGLFAQIGRNVINIGSVMNLTLTPREVNFTNANCVGALAGTLTYGYIYNVDVATDDELVVTGKNFVSGLIGRAINSYVVKNVSSNLSAISTYLPVETDEENGKDNNSYSQSANKIDAYSYAGAIIGFAGGMGTIDRVSANNIHSVRGDRTGVAIGGIDTNVKANYIFVNVADDLAIRSSKYAGFAVGEVKGSLRYVDINGTGAVQNNIVLSPNVPTAVGGIAGIVNGGSIEEAYMSQGFRLGTKPNTYQRILYAGGIAGRVIGDSRISKVVIDKDIEVSSTLGGAVGRAGGSLKLDQIAIKSSRLYVYGADMSRSNLGGVIGVLDGYNTVEMTNIYSNANLELNTSVYGSQIQANVGAFVGSGTPLRMSYCYSTGSTAVKLEDLRGASEDLHAVTDLVGGTEPDIDGITYSFIEKDETASDSSRVQFKKTINTGNFDHIYFYGTNFSGVNNFGTYSNMIKYEAKKYRQNVTLVENVHGVGSYQYVETSTDKSALNTIFSGYYLDASIGTRYGSINSANAKLFNKVYDFVTELYDSADKNSKVIDKFVPRGDSTYYYALYNAEWLPRESSGALIYNPTPSASVNYEQYYTGKYVRYKKQDKYVQKNGRWTKDGEAWLIDTDNMYSATSIGSTSHPSLLRTYESIDFTKVENVYMGGNNVIYYAFGQREDDLPEYYISCLTEYDSENECYIYTYRKYIYTNGVYKLNGTTSGQVLDTSQLRTGLWAINRNATPSLTFETQMIWRQRR